MDFTAMQQDGIYCGVSDESDIRTVSGCLEKLFSRNMVM